jgi:hypothetical protein
LGAFGPVFNPRILRKTQIIDKDLEKELVKNNEELTKGYQKIKDLLGTIGDYWKTK